MHTLAIRFLSVMSEGTYRDTVFVFSEGAACGHISAVCTSIGMNNEVMTGVRMAASAYPKNLVDVVMVIGV